MGDVLSRSGPVEFISISIADGATLSAAFEVPGRIVALEIPVTAEGTTYKIKATSDPVSGTYAFVQDTAGTDFSVTCTTLTAEYVAIEPAKLIGARYCKLHAGTAQTGASTYKVGFIR